MTKKSKRTAAAPVPTGARTKSTNAAVKRRKRGCRTRAADTQAPTVTSAAVDTAPASCPGSSLDTGMRYHSNSSTINSMICGANVIVQHPNTSICVNSSAKTLKKEDEDEIDADANADCYADIGSCTEDTNHTVFHGLSPAARDADSFWTRLGEKATTIFEESKSLNEDAERKKVMQDVSGFFDDFPHLPESIRNDVMSILLKARDAALRTKPDPTCTTNDTTVSMTMERIIGADQEISVGKATKAAEVDADDSPFPAATQPTPESTADTMELEILMNNPEIREYFAKKEAKIAAEIAKLRAEKDAEISKVRADKDAEISKLRADKDAEIAKKDAEIAKKDAQLFIINMEYDAKKILTSHISGVLKRIRNIGHTLDNLIVQSQTHHTQGVYGSTLQSLIKKNAPILRNDKNLAEGDKLPEKASPQRYIEELLATAVHDLDENFLKLKDVKKDDFTNIKRVSDIFQQFIASRRTEIITKKKKISKSIAATIRKLESNLASSENQPISPPGSSSVGTKNCLSNDTANFVFPGALVNEVHGVQPMVHLMLRALSKCLPRIIPQSIPASPSKTRVLREKPLVATESRGSRKVDFVVERPCNRFYFLLHDYVMELVCEAKPGCRDKIGPIKILGQARDQCLSHVAKYILMGLNFADGAGTNTHGTCFVVTLAAIQVFQLRLLDVGTESASLKLHQSTVLPLMTISNFEKWVLSAGGKHKNEFNELRAVLYSKDNGLLDGVPLGYLCIYQLMKKSRKDLFGPTDPFKGTNVGGLIGRGSLADVYEYKIEGECTEKYVLKISRYGAAQGIKNESEILQMLHEINEMQGMCEKIPKVHEYYANFPISLGHMNTTLPAIAMSPRGVVATSIASIPMESHLRDELFSVILKDVIEALDFIHKNDVQHNDLSPKNIIFVNCGTEAPYAVLIDFSIATRKGAKLNGFNGTIDFVHKDIFKFYPSQDWEPETKYDYAGLVYTMAKLLDKAVHSFPSFAGFPCRLKTEEKVKELGKLVEERNSYCHRILNQKKDFGKQLIALFEKYCDP